MMDMLRHERITLLSTDKWADQNDRHTMEVYAARKKTPSVVAYCMTEAAETAHHWQLFAGHDFGACVVFKKAEFTDFIRNRRGLRCENIDYWTLARLEREQPISVEVLPFIKRAAFEAEREVRIIADHDASLDGPTQHVSIRRSLIDRIVFSPFAVRSLVENAKDVMLDFKGCSTVRFVHSALMNNRKWMREADKVLPGGRLK
ncbi:MAG: hypothetical protein EOP83_34550 [Verrucomicrobiaceae bacterium]|nr:MAG: hypothetical protein EOP83_34550 [Verrucomicrobiaceae bacterium]